MAADQQRKRGSNRPRGNASSRGGVTRQSVTSERVRRLRARERRWAEFVRDKQFVEDFRARLRFLRWRQRLSAPTAGACNGSVDSFSSAATRCLRRRMKTCFRCGLRALARATTTGLLRRCAPSTPSSSRRASAREQIRPPHPQSPQAERVAAALHGAGADALPLGCAGARPPLLRARVPRCLRRASRCGGGRPAVGERGGPAASGRKEQPGARAPGREAAARSAGGLAHRMPFAKVGCSRRSKSHAADRTTHQVCERLPVVGVAPRGPACRGTLQRRAWPRRIPPAATHRRHRRLQVFGAGSSHRCAVRRACRRETTAV